MLVLLSSLHTADELRACLAEGLAATELEVGFDEITIVECIEHVVAAAMEDRSSGSQEARKRLTNSLKAYFAATREAAVRRLAGAASCLPPLR